jgi:hypothetical protein
LLDHHILHATKHSQKPVHYGPAGWLVKEHRRCSRGGGRQPTPESAEACSTGDQLGSARSIIATCLPVQFSSS